VNEHEDIYITAHLSETLTGSVKAGTIISMAHKMFVSALLYLEKLYELENLDNEADFKVAEDLYDAYSISVVVLCVSALEAGINEFYEFGCGQQGAIREHLGILRDEGYLVTARYRITEKYNTVLALLKKRKFVDKKPKKSNYKGDMTQYEFDDKDYKFFQSVENLVRLRNAIIHYNPEIYYSAKERAKISDDFFNRLSSKFKNKRGSDGRNLPYFPSQCLGFGSAKWAVTTTFLFWEEFFNRTEVDREINYNKLLKTSVEKWLS